MILFLLVSNSLVKELAQQERDRMDIWASATEKLAKADTESDFEFLLAIISQNNSIPVLVTDSAYNILDFRNFPLPDKTDMDSESFEELSPQNKEFLRKIIIEAGEGRPLPDLAKNHPHFIKKEIYFILSICMCKFCDMLIGCIHRANPGNHFRLEVGSQALGFLYALRKKLLFD